MPKRHWRYNRHPEIQVHLDHLRGADVQTGYEVTAEVKMPCPGCHRNVKLPSIIIGTVKKAIYRSLLFELPPIYCSRCDKSFTVTWRQRRFISREAKRETEWYIFFVTNPIDMPEIKQISG